MNQKNYTVGIETLGCKVNQYESEAIAEEFQKRGWTVCPSQSTCDAYVINTCTVTAESDRKARQFIRRAIRKNENAFILVTGCFSQTDPDSVAKIEGVDFICGNAKKMQVVDEAIKLAENGKKNDPPVVSVTEADARGFERMAIEHFDRTRAYVKIEDGCESRCTYCIIPDARGKIRSKCPSEVIEEVKELTRGGCREVVLTGIETGSYGKDLDGYTLADLLEELDKIPGIGRVRLGSLDPSIMKQSFVDRIAKLSSLAPHFHLSLQSGSDTVLARMKRKYNAKMALEGMERIRKAMPNVQFTTDMIVGFPGETQEEFEETLRFVKKARLLKIHVFPYSRRKGTPADLMPNQVPEPIKHERVAVLSLLDESIRREILQNQIGKKVSVLFETYSKAGNVGHTDNFLEVYCPTKENLHGQIKAVRIISADENQCIGEIAAE